MTRPNLSLRAIGEFGLIDRLRGIVSATVPEGLVGIGDDCAVVTAPKGRLLLTSDLMVEGRHFDWALTSAYDLGWKLMAVNLSDIAACGGAPIAALLTVQARSGIESALIEEVYRGAAAHAAAFHVAIAGGDTVAAADTVFGATLLGVSHSPVLRSGARPGDELWVSGRIGDGGLGLAILRGEISAPDDVAKIAREKYLRPAPRIALGEELANQKLATSMLDVSDGLFQDAGHIASLSGVRLVIDLERLPASSIPSWSLARACSAGDDYELLFTAAPEHGAAVRTLAALGAPVTCIGRVEAGETEVVAVSPGGAPVPVRELLARAGLPAGHDHFRPGTDSE